MRFAILAIAMTVPFTYLPVQADAPAKPDLKAWNEAADRASKYLRENQDKTNGSWSNDKAQAPGITGIVVTGLCRTDRVPKNDPMLKSAVKYIESLVNEKEHHLAGNDPKVQLKNYVTAINIMALNAYDRYTYRKTIDQAVAFLKDLQWDEGEGKKPDNDFFGGAGYDSNSRPDLSNTQMFLDALKDAGVKSDDPAFRKALVFVNRCQNHKGEHNDRPWAGKINDGSFIYSCAGGGESKVGGDPETGLLGHGAMTYAGMKSMLHCGVNKDDPRLKKALEWIRKNYSVEAHSGMKDPNLSLFYYYHTMAKTLDTLGIDTLEDAAGNKHDWRSELLAALLKRQKANGSWANEVDRWMENDPNLVTGYALMTLAYLKPAK